MSSKKNCGCGQDPCKTYGAETFEARTTRKGGTHRPTTTVRDGTFIYTHKKDGIPMDYDNQKVRKLNKDLRQQGIPLKTKTKNAETFEAENERPQGMSYFFVYVPSETGRYGREGEKYDVHYFRTLDEAQKAFGDSYEIYEYRDLDDVPPEEREKQKQDGEEWYDRSKKGEFFEDFWWKDEMSRYSNSDAERLHYSTYDSSVENDERDGFYAKTILPSNPSGFEQETNQAYAQQLGISERLGALLNSSRSFGMSISQRAHPDTVKKYRQRILDGFDAYGPESKKEQKIVKMVRQNMATRGVKGPRPSYYSTSLGIVRKPELSYYYDDYYDNPIPFMGYELTDEEKKIIGDVKSAETFGAESESYNKLHSWANNMFRDVKDLIYDLENGDVYDLDDCRERLEKIRDDTSHLDAENFEAYSSVKGHFRRKKAPKSPASEILTFSAVSGIALGLIYFWKGK